MQKTNIIVCHPDQGFSQTLGEHLTRAGYNVVRLADEQALSAYLSTSRADLLIADDQLADRDLLKQALNADFCAAGCPMILIAEQVSVQRAVALVQAGASDYLPADVDAEELLQSVQRALHANTSAALKRKQACVSDRPIVTRSPVMQDLLKTAAQVAASNATILIQGESGTGKELIARFIHARSKRAPHIFVAMNCAALPENLAESELFGYEKGAFTGAFRRKSGKFEQAHGGTLLLDEISEMDLALQAKLLRALQDRQIDPVGGTRPLSVDARVVATTNRDLLKMVRQGRFREDLYYRLRVIPMTIPPLRARREDIPALIEHFLKRHAPAQRTPSPALAPAALERLLTWPWPGNVRELENTIARALLICNGAQIDEHCLLLEEDLASEDLAPAAGLVGLTVKELEKRLIEQTLSHVNQNRTCAAKMLGISIRTLRNKLHEYRSSQSRPDSP